jgi:predicted TPR repeat methyltransferase
MKGDQEVSLEEALQIGIQYHQRGDLALASGVYDDILKAVPDSADALHYKGMLQHQVGESEAAIELISRALELVPVYPAALNNLGNVLRESGRLEEAQERYREVLEISPEHVDALVNMGVVHIGLKNTSDALEYLEKALAIDPKHVAAWHNLGNLYSRQELYDEARSAFEKSAELAPTDTKSFKEIAKVLYKSGNKKDAVKTLESLLDRNPDDEVARHMIASFGGTEAPDRASDQFVTETFDTFAVSFDASLARLKYKAPQLVGDELKRLTSSDRKIDILDIGCGTGLCGPIVKPLASVLVGVDLSPGMLRKARQRDTYDSLHQAELTAFMQNSDVTYDAIICVDTFVYFGKLDEAFVAAESILNADGHLIFTVERHTRDECADDFRLQDHGRYSHIDEYLERSLAATGLLVQSLTPVIPRMEVGEPVSGLLVVARKVDE